MFEKKVGRPSNETIKKRRIFKFGIAAVILAVVGVIGGFAYARYSFSATGSGNIDVAQWNIKMKDGAGTLLSNNNDVTVRLIDNADIDSGKVAPGSKFEIIYQIDPAGSEVAVESSFTCLKEGNINARSLLMSNDMTTALKYSIISASYTIDGVETAINLNEKSETFDVPEGAPMGLTSFTVNYAYPSNIIKIPLSKIEEGKGLTTVKLVAQVDDTEDIDGYYFDDYDDSLTYYLDTHLTTDDFQIKLFAAQDTDSNYLLDESNLNFDFGIQDRVTAIREDLNTKFGS